MKNIIVLIALMAMTVAQAQQGRKGEKGERMKNVNSQEMATMQSKKMTLALDLSDKQEKEIFQILVNQAENRKANKMSKEDHQKLTDEQKKAKKIAVMDEKIAAKRAMKKILNENQYAKWEKMIQKRMGKRSKKGNKKRRKRD